MGICYWGLGGGHWPLNTLTTSDYIKTQAVKKTVEWSLMIVVVSTTANAAFTPQITFCLK